MVLTKLTNIHGDFEYINLERVTSVVIQNTCYDITVADGEVFTIAKIDAIITALITAANTA